MPKKEQASILSQEELAEGIYSMWLRADAAGFAKPGQFLSLYTKDRSKLLPRPISICEINRERGALRLVYRVTGEDTGTEQFSRLAKGDAIPLIGPLGNGFPLERAEGRRVVLVGGGIGIPPILGLARALRSASCCKETAIIAGYRDGQTFLKEEMEQWGRLYLATEDGSVGTKGTVLDVIGKKRLEAELLYACGPRPMLSALKAYAEERRVECYISLEERMACGIGACLACVCQSTDRDSHSNVKNKRVCKDGPVFLASEVEL